MCVGSAAAAAAAPAACRLLLPLSSPHWPTMLPAGPIAALTSTPRSSWVLHGGAERPAGPDACVPPGGRGPRLRHAFLPIAVSLVGVVQCSALLCSAEPPRLRACHLQACAGIHRCCWPEGLSSATRASRRRQSFRCRRCRRVLAAGLVWSGLGLWRIASTCAGCWAWLLGLARPATFLLLCSPTTCAGELAAGRLAGAGLPPGAAARRTRATSLQVVQVGQVLRESLYLLLGPVYCRCSTRRSR